MHFASDFDRLKSLNITAVVSAIDLGIVYPASVNHYKLNLRDA